MVDSGVTAKWIGSSKMFEIEPTASVKKAYDVIGKGDCIRLVNPDPMSSPKHIDVRVGEEFAANTKSLCINLINNGKDSKPLKNPGATQGGWRIFINRIQGIGKVSQQWIKFYSVSVISLYKLLADHCD